MAKLNSIELKHKRKILNWAGQNWHKLKESSKVRIFCSVLDKSEPSTLKIEGEIEHYFDQSNKELDRMEEEILKFPAERLTNSEN